MRPSLARQRWVNTPKYPATNESADQCTCGAPYCSDAIAVAEALIIATRARIVRSCMASTSGRGSNMGTKCPLRAGLSCPQNS